MRTVLYLCYGSGPQVSETIYSLHSALRLAPPSADLRYVVYADHPEQFTALDVDVREIEAGELDAWMDGTGYVHRRKTMTIIDALTNFPGSIAFVDCDTYFLRSPEKLFARIAPGRSCLHLKEARLLESGTAVDRAISDLVRDHEFHDISGRLLEISPDAMMWNSGVVGIHSADLPLMYEALNLIDEMWGALKASRIEERSGYPVHHIEQFATGLMLSRNIVTETGNVVFHYWPENLRGSFRARLPAVLAEYQADGNANRLYAARPRADFRRKIKQNIRALLRTVGLSVTGMRASA